MPAHRKKSPATEGKRKTRDSDKARTSPRKMKKSKTASLNDGSYLQLPDQQASVSTVTSSADSKISASTGQVIIDMLNKLDASNQELTRRMDRFQRGSVTSTPLTSPTIPPRSHTQVASTQHSVFTAPLLHQPSSVRLAMTNTEGHGSSTVHTRLPAAVNQARDAIGPKVDVLRSVPSISTAVSQLLANYEQQADREVLQGKSTVIRKKSGRYNTTDMTSLGPQFCWPNEGLVSASHLRKPVYDDLTLAQWVSGQLANILLIEDHTLSRNMLTQMAASMKDAVSLLWPAVRSAWAVSMTDIEEGRLSWADSMQWSINRISNSQLAMHNTQSVAASGAKVRICRYFNEGTCTSETHHGAYKHYCSHCYKQGRSLGHTELKCFHCSSTGNQDQRSVTAK